MSTARTYLSRSLVCLALALVACAGAPPISLRAGPRAFTQVDYETVYEAWTRSEDDFAWNQMRDVLHVTATFESWEFRWAYVVRYAHDYALPTAARTEMLRATLADARQHHRFFVSLSGNQFREANLSSDHSAWRVLLVDEEERQEPPIEIERIRRPGAPEVVYFPSITDHRFVFRIVFPARRADGTPTIRPDADFVVLRFTGARGRLDLRWDFVPPGHEDDTDE